MLLKIGNRKILSNENDRRMGKILILSDFGKFGGTRTYFLSLLNFLYSKNCTIFFVGENTENDPELEQVLRRLNVQKYHLPNFSSLKFFRKIFFFQIIFDLFTGLYLQIKLNPNIVFISNGEPGKNLGMMLIFSRFVYITHTYPSCNKPLLLPNMLFTKIFLNLSINPKKVILTVSEFSRKTIINCWVGGRKSSSVITLYNYSMAPSSTEFSTITGELKNSCITVLTIGHVVAYKNPKVWINVAKQVLKLTTDGTVKFIWVGEGQLLDDCIEYVKSNNLKNIEFVGYHQDVEYFFASSNVYFQPSLIESQGISVLDAMAKGLPCVVSNVGGLPESVNDGVTGYVVDVNDINTMVEKILLLVKNFELRQEMGNAGKILYKENFSYEIWRRNMDSIYDFLLGNK